jgi:hypothetical protein
MNLKNEVLLLCPYDSSLKLFKTGFEKKNVIHTRQQRVSSDLGILCSISRVCTFTKALKFITLCTLVSSIAIITTITPVPIVTMLNMLPIFIVIVAFR